MRVSDNLQLKREYDIFKELHSLSGFGWDEATQRFKANKNVWDEYIKVCLTRIYAGLLTCPFLQSHPRAAPFRNKGFPLFDEIGNLIDGTRATGEFAFRAGQSPGPSKTRHSSPATPPGDDFDSRIDPALLEISNKTKNKTRARTPFDWEKDEYSDNETPITVSLHLSYHHTHALTNVPACSE